MTIRISKLDEVSISIVIPTYNRAQLLPRAVRSIPKDLSVEIIIVDDGSTDNTKNIVMELQNKDIRIHFIQLLENKGVNVARNAGIRHATGDWICFLDSDDEYFLNALKKMITTLSSAGKNIDVIGFMTMREEEGGVMEPRGYRTEERWNTYEPTYEDILLKRNITGDISYCIRRKLFVQGYKFANYINGFESAFFAKLAKDGKKFLYVNSVVDMRHSGFDIHLSTKPYKRWSREFARAYKEFVYEHYTVLQKYPTILRHYYLRIAKCFLLTGNPCGLWWFVKAHTIKSDDK